MIRLTIITIKNNDYKSAKKAAPSCNET